MRNAIRLAAILAIWVPAFTATAQAPCVLEDNGSGTVDLPPEECGYLSPSDVHELIDSSTLPPGTTIEFDVSHRNFVCSQNGDTDNGFPGATGYGGSCSVVVDPETCEAAGPVTGTVIECFTSEAVIELTGTGSLAGYSETLTVSLFTEVLADRGLGDPTPSFDTEMTWISGELPPGASPNFCQLIILGGTDNTSSPNTGHVDLTSLPGGHFQVDSTFDVSYSILYQGCPGSVLDGLGGISEEQTVTMQAAALPTGIPAAGPLAFGVLAAVLIGGAFRYRRRS